MRGFFVAPVQKLQIEDHRSSRTFAELLLAVAPAAALKPSSALGSKPELDDDASAADPDYGTVVHLTQPCTGQRVTLIGTSHLSVASVAQVANEVRGSRPEVVVIELDRARLAHFNLTDADFVVAYRTAEGIVPPRDEDDIVEATRMAKWHNSWWRLARAIGISILARVARCIIAAQYRDASKKMGLRPGEEFAEAMRVANQLGVPCVLADRSVADTTTRLAELVLRSGLLNTLRRLMSFTIDDELTFDGCEAQVRERLLARCQEELPEIFRALINERNYIMAQAILHELAEPHNAAHVCVVVGMGHLSGIQEHLQTSWQ